MTEPNGGSVYRLKICPYCGKPYNKPSALSRKDNKTDICPDCGALEAMESIGISQKEREAILQTMHRYGY